MRRRSLLPALGLNLALVACGEGQGTPAVVRWSTGGAPGAAGHTGAAPAGGGAAGTGAPLARLDLSLLDPAWLSAAPALDGIDEARTRADELVDGLTLDEKLGLVHGTTGAYVGNVAGVARLGIPALTLQDGPAGVARFADVTAFPAPLTLAASFDRELVRRWGAAMAREQRGKGVMVQLGPMMNLARVPAAGRNFESFGEDPFLAGALAAEAVRGIQGEGVVATAKHYAGNEQETARFTSSSEIDARSLHELYYTPFEAAVAAGAGAVMCAYNKLDGVHACEHPDLLADLKQGMGFSGWVMSDWGATHSAAAAANAGLDMEMPGGDWFGAPLASAIADGSVSLARLDDMVRRLLISIARAGLLDDPPTGTPETKVSSPESTALALEAALAGITLLRNEDRALPLVDLGSVAVIGSAASTGAASVGGGSAYVTPPYVVSPLDALHERVEARLSVSYAQGDGASLEDAVAVASAADAAVVIAAVPSSEGEDRKTLALPAEIDRLIEAVAAANPRTIVVLYTPGAVLMPWLDRVEAALVSGYPGQENGHALAAVLIGDEGPGGKLPVTFPLAEADLPRPGLEQSVPYAEGLNIGYRGLDAAGLTPLFPFGHGLAYTRFEYARLELTACGGTGELCASFDLMNAGDREGSEVAQLYLGYPAHAGEPPRVLRGFARVRLAAGASRRVTLKLTARELRSYDAEARAFRVPSGTYRISIGSSSRDLRLETELEVVGSSM